LLPILHTSPYHFSQKQLIVQKLVHDVKHKSHRSLQLLFSTQMWQTIYHANTTLTAKMKQTEAVW